jgi:hypothetical protein
MSASTVRAATGTLAGLLFFFGRGARATGVKLQSEPDYWLGITAHAVAAIIALLAFVVAKKTRLDGPQGHERLISPLSVGYALLATAALLLLSVSTLFVLGAADPGPSDAVVRRILSVPDIGLKLVMAILVAAAGASAVGGRPHAATLVRIAAVPLTLVWPLGTMLGAWAAWSTLGPAWQQAAREPVAVP